MLGALLDLDRVFLPEREGIHRSGRPGPAGTAMAIAHGLRRTVRLDLDRTAKTTSDMAHYFPPYDEYGRRFFSACGKSASAQKCARGTLSPLPQRLTLDNTSVFVRMCSNHNICGIMKHRCRHLIR